METLERALRVLELFLSHEDSLSLTELIKSSGLSPAVTHRIVTTLIQKGYLIQKEKRGKYSLGLKFLDYYFILQENLKINNIALPFLIDFNKEVNEAVTLGILDDKQLLVIERIETSQALRVSGSVGMRAPLYTTAIGKILLSQLSESEKEAVFHDRSIEKFSTSQKVDIPKIEKELALIKIEGCAFDKGETSVGVWSVAAPIYRAPGEIEAGLALVVPTARVSDERALTLTALTKSYAAKISQKLRYLPGLKSR